MILGRMLDYKYLDGNGEGWCIHGINALGEVGFKGEKLFPFLGESSNLGTGTNKDLLLWSSHNPSKIHSDYLLAGKGFEHGLKQSQVSSH